MSFVTDGSSVSRLKISRLELGGGWSIQADSTGSWALFNPNGVKVLAIDPSTLSFTKVNSFNATGVGIPYYSASNIALANTGNITVISFSPTGLASWRIGGFITVTAFTSGTIQLQIGWTDQNSNAQTMILPLIKNDGTVVQSANATGHWAATETEIRTHSATPVVTVKTIGTYVATYDAAAFALGVD